MLFQYSLGLKTTVPTENQHDFLNLMSNDMPGSIIFCPPHPAMLDHYKLLWNVLVCTETGIIRLLQ